MKHSPRIAELEAISRDRALAEDEVRELVRRLEVDRRRRSRRVQRVRDIRAKIERLCGERDKLALRRFRYKEQIALWRKRLAELEAECAAELADQIEEELRGCRSRSSLGRSV